MLQIPQAGNLTLHEVKQKFNLHYVTDPDFFPEWQIPAPELNEHEQYTLDKTKADFQYLDEYPLHEEMVKLVILSPLLSVAGFYSRAFCPVTERQIELDVQEAEERIRGRIDILVLNEQLWVSLIESKSKRFGVREALPQAITYMMATPDSQPISYGLTTNGSEFLFLKLLKGEQPQYGFSRLFSLFNPGNELAEVVGILRVLSQAQSAASAA